MSTYSRLLRQIISLSCLLVLMVGAVSAAVPRAVPVRFWGGGGAAFNWENNPGGLTIDIAGLESTPGAGDGYRSLNGMNFATGFICTDSNGKAHATVSLEPGKTYYVGMTGGWLEAANIGFAPPPGYRIEINGEIRQRYEEIVAEPSEVYSEVVTLRVLGPATDFSGPAGQASALANERLFWQVALGSLRNGASAGALTLVDAGNSGSWSTVFTPASLHYQPPSDEVIVYRSAGRIRQILAPAAAVDVVTSTEDSSLGANQFEIRFYPPDQATGSSLPRTMGGAAFVTYRVEQGATNTTLMITSTTRQLEESGQPVKRTALTSVSRSGSWPSFTWTLKGWNTSGQTQQTEVVTVSSGTASAREVDSTASAANGSTALFMEQSHALKSWGEAVTGQSRGASNPLASAYQYYENSAEAGRYGFVKQVTNNDGSWEAFDYWTSTNPGNDTGLLKYRFRPFNSSPASVSFDPALGEVTYFEYGLDPFGMKTRPTLVRTTVNNILTGETVIQYQNESSPVNGMTVVRATRTDQSDSGGQKLTQVTRFYAENATPSADPGTKFFRNLVHSVTQPNGVRKSFFYQRGMWDGSAFAKNGSDGSANWNGVPPSGSQKATRTGVIVGLQTGSSLLSYYDGYRLDDVHLVANKSTLELTIRDSRANIVRTESHVWTGSAWALVASIDYEHTLSGRVRKSTQLNDAVNTAEYSGEQKVAETDETGLRISYTYDDAGRVRTATKENGPTTTYGYNVAGQILTETLSGAGTYETIVRSRHYDSAGRLADETAPGLGQIMHSYNVAGRSHTVTTPDTATRTETFQIDGRLASITGSGVVEEHYTHEVLSGGVRYARVNIGALTSPRWRQAWSDWLGRRTKASRPGWPGEPAIEEEHTYEAGTGYLVKTTRTGYAPTRYEYDELGAVRRSGLDVGNNGALDLASLDRIVDTDTAFEAHEDAWWLTTTTTQYPFADSDTPKISSVNRIRLTGFDSGVVAEERRMDAELNTAKVKTTINRSSKTMVVSTTVPGLATPAVATVVNGLLTSSVDHAGLTTTWQHDPLDRSWKVTNAREKITTTAYKTGTNLPESITDATSTVLALTSYDVMGRPQWTRDAASKYTRFAYTDRGLLWRQWGDGAYPVEYGYDSIYGDHKTINTFRNAPGVDSSTWPSVGAADTTTFDYDPGTGLLHKRIDAVGNFVEFAYNHRGQIKERYSARLRADGTQRILATYAYDGGTGELTGVSYNDTTPSVAYGYSRIGQLDKVQDYTTATNEWRTFTYDSARPWRLKSDALPAFYNSRVVTSLYENETSGLVGRYLGFQLGASVGSNSDLEQAYSYAPSGRLETLASRSAGNSISRTFRYGYLANSPLVETLTIEGSHPFTVTRGYHPDLDLLASIETKWSASAVVRYDYTYNGRYQRESAKQSGSAFADYGAPTFTRYNYNARGELTGAPGYLGADVANTSQPLPGRQHGYDYDSTGNRKWAERTGVVAQREGYSANALNQYTNKENHTVPVQGTVDSAGTPVVAEGMVPQRQGRYWAAEVAPGNGSAPWTGTVTAHAAKPGGGTGGLDLVRSESRSAQLAQALQSFTYDEDGNLTSDGIWDYQWDAENRLVRAATTSVALVAGYPNKVMEFRYDYLGRRVMKRAANVSGSERRYLYHGWNVVAEFDVSGALLRSFTWGLDLAGSLDASGGLGALLQIRDVAQGKTILPAYDGHGNVAALLDAESGAVSAAYEYDPSGKLLRSEGTYAASNPFRFSTKWHDDETGLVYYGYRYYSPNLGRFINRDPIKEVGGLNIYGFAGNDGVNRFDFLGLDDEEILTLDPFGVGGLPLGGALGGGGPGGGITRSSSGPVFGYSTLTSSVNLESAPDSSANTLVLERFTVKAQSLGAYFSVKGRGLYKNLGLIGPNHYSAQLVYGSSTLGGTSHVDVDVQKVNIEPPAVSHEDLGSLTDAIAGAATSITNDASSLATFVLTAISYGAGGSQAGMSVREALAPFENIGDRYLTPLFSEIGIDTGSYSYTTFGPGFANTVLLATGITKMAVEQAATRITVAAENAFTTRQAAMLQKNVGYNISPEAWFSKYPALGRGGSFVTDYRAVGEILGPVRANRSFSVGLFSGEGQISYLKAWRLERALGIDRGSLSGGFRFTRVPGINAMAPRSPLAGNKYFLGPGQGLPGGGPEMVIDSIPTSPWP